MTTPTVISWNLKFETNFIMFESYYYDLMGNAILQISWK